MLMVEMSARTTRGLQLVKLLMLSISRTVKACSLQPSERYLLVLHFTFIPLYTFVWLFVECGVCGMPTMRDTCLRARPVASWASAHFAPILQLNIVWYQFYGCHLHPLKCLKLSYVIYNYVHLNQWLPVIGVIRQVSCDKQVSMTPVGKNFET